MESNNTKVIHTMTIIIFIYRYIFWIFSFLGIVGHLLNIYIFTQSCFRSNPCSVYFLASTITNLIIVSIFIPFKILQYGFDIDPRTSSLVFCKLYSFSNDSARILSSWFLIFACIDRFCFTSSNMGVRQLSTITHSRFVISLFTIFLLIIHIHIILFYTIDNRIGKCVSYTGIYQLFNRVYHLLMNIICPPLFMCIFSLLILNNIRQERNRISLFMIGIVYNHHIIRKKRRLSNQIYIMLFIQCLVFILINIPWFINYIYSIIKGENFENIAVLISLIGHCITFYLFLLSSQLFRREVIKFYKIIRIFSF